MYKNIATLIVVLLFLSCRKDSLNNRANNKVNISTTEFVVIGHAYGNPNSFKLKLYEKLVPALAKYNQLIKPYKVIFTGDVVAKPIEENWTNVINEMDSINLDYYISPGNHDLGSDYFQNNVQNDLFFSHRHNQNLFLILNTNYKGWTVNQPQIELIKTELSHLQNIQNVFVFSHQIWWANKNEATIEFDTILSNSNYLINGPSTFWTDALPMFKSIETPVYFFAGDIGAFSQIPAYTEHHSENLHFYGSGVGGGVDDNFLYISVTENGAVTVNKVNF